ncbi:malonate decarboxylase holo-ACP synthase [Acinetobacter sp. ANC 4779]|uniref:malonate decarboxylase holo-ACP synthase n=1 Tax=Acinetobacter sp. ANC 4779 TaxID=2529848 RepID=UPI00103E1F8F|nr:malonate decarboxylase holo-ACP synthase [Acinetobacter sp. ANC 4779]TCB48064.1 malonate decarboxylase holo-ACP synthase [Acinetobacter sp. ANC 4779]
MQMHLQAHDLLWGMTLDFLQDDVPVWVKDTVPQGHPVVVRRALTDTAAVAVGIRGKARNERYAAHMPIAAITKQLKPEALSDLNLQCFPHLMNQLQIIQKIMQQKNWTWGYTGSVGFELATSIKTVTANSDIDLLIRTEEFLHKDDAKQLVQQLEHTELKLDVQLQTPNGGVALKEWARTTGKVLLKRNDCAVLVNDPWQ